MFDTIEIFGKIRFLSEFVPGSNLFEMRNNFRPAYEM